MGTQINEKVYQQKLTPAFNFQIYRALKMRGHSRIVFVLLFTSMNCAFYTYVITFVHNVVLFTKTLNMSVNEASVLTFPPYPTLWPTQPVDIYHPPTKLPEDNVFSLLVIQSTGGEWPM